LKDSNLHYSTNDHFGGIAGQEAIEVNETKWNF